MPPPDPAKARAYADAVAQALDKTAQSVAALQANLIKAGDALKAALGAVPAQARQATTAIDQMAGAVANVARVAAYGFLAAKVSLLGFVRAGLEGTAQAAMLSFHMQMLSRHIAAIFLPVVDKVVQKLGELTAWFGQLSQKQQDNIQRWTLGGLAVLGMASALPRLAAGFQLVTSLIPGLSAAITGLLSSTGIGAFLPLIGAVVALLTGFAVGTEAGRRSVDKLWKALEPLGEALSRILDRMGPLIEKMAAFAAKMVETLATGYAAYLTKIADAILAISDAFDKLNAMAEKGEKAMGRFGNALAIFRRFAEGLAAGGVFGAVANVSKGGADGTDKAGRGIQPGGQFEEIDALFKRIQSAATSEGKKPEEQTAENTQRILTNMETLLQIVQFLRSPPIPGVPKLL